MAASYTNWRHYSFCGEGRGKIILPASWL